MKSVFLSLLLDLACTGCTCCSSAPLLAPENAESRTLFQFSQNADLRGWKVENDSAASGHSTSRLFINEAGNAIFTGDLSGENKETVPSVQYSFSPIRVSDGQAVVLGLKGDGKRYQLRVESGPKAPRAYVSDFETSGEWQTIEISFASLRALPGGDEADPPSFPAKTMSAIHLLAANGTPGSFQLEIDRIWLK